MAAARARTIVAWALSVLLAFFMVGGGAAKLSGDAVMVDMFDHIGAGQWLRYVVGALEVAGGIGLLIPRVRSLAALGLVLLLLCATATNLAILHVSPVVALAVAALAAVIFVLRRHELASVFGRPARSSVKDRALPESAAIAGR